jgi:hypothetical protein
MSDSKLRDAHEQGIYDRNCYEGARVGYARNSLTNLLNRA